MRVALIAGVGGHAEPFEAALVALEAAGVDRVLVLGDLVGPGPSPERVVARLAARGEVSCTAGALDRWVIGREESRPGARLEACLRHTRRRLSLEALAWLEERPERLTLDLGAWRIEVLPATGGDGAEGARLDLARPAGPGTIAITPGSAAGWLRTSEGLRLFVPPLLPREGDDPRARWLQLDLPDRGVPEAQLLRVPFPLRRELERVERLVAKGELDRRSGVVYARQRLGRRRGAGRPTGSPASAMPVLVDLARAVYRPMSGRWPDDDVPVVHEVRVATRRLQEALQLLQSTPGAQRAPAAIRRLRVLRRRLAARRAVDVQLLCLHEQLERAAVSPNERRALVAALERMRHRVTAKILEGRVRAKYARHGLLVLDLAMQVESAPWRRLLPEHLMRRVEECRQRAAALEDETDAPAHHEFRKAMKRLRYACELADLALGEQRASGLLAFFRSLQDALGHYNDMYELRLLMDAQEVVSGLEPSALERLRTHFQEARHAGFLHAREVVKSALPELFREVGRLAASFPGSQPLVRN